MRFGIRQPTENQVLEELIPISKEVGTQLEKLDDTYTAALALDIPSDKATRDQLALSYQSLEQAHLHLEKACRLAKDE